MRRARAWLLALVVAAGGCRAPEPAPLTVLAAASLTDALAAVVDSFAAAHPGLPVRVSVGGSSLLARQVAGGAPADLFLSASTAWVDTLVAQGHARAPVVLPLRNHLVVAARAGVDVGRRPADLAALPRLALADPDHVPAGAYARAALACAGLWVTMQPRLVPTLDVRAALAAVQAGAAPAALVYASDVRVAQGVVEAFAWPAACQPPVRYAAAFPVQAAHPEAAVAFLDYAFAPARAALWQRYGFGFAAEEAP